MKRPQAIPLIFVIATMVITLMSFTTEHVQKDENTSVSIIDLDQDGMDEKLIGIWVKQNDPDSHIMFSPDHTVVKKNKDQVIKDEWSVKGSSKQVCIGKSNCISYSISKDVLYLYVDDQKVAYTKLHEE